MVTGRARTATCVLRTTLGPRASDCVLVLYQGVIRSSSALVAARVTMVHLVRAHVRATRASARPRTALTAMIRTTALTVSLSALGMSIKWRAPDTARVSVGRLATEPVCATQATPGITARRNAQAPPVLCFVVGMANVSMDYEATGHVRARRTGLLRRVQRASWTGSDPTAQRCAQRTTWVSFAAQTVRVITITARRSASATPGTAVGCATSNVEETLPALVTETAPRHQNHVIVYPRTPTGIGLGICATYVSTVGVAMSVRQRARWAQQRKQRNLCALDTDSAWTGCAFATALTRVKRTITAARRVNSLGRRSARM
eukprot:PhM_4_TR16808/c0_g1_i3/m.52177